MTYSAKDLERAAESFAKYHEEHARYGGASHEFHARAETFLRTVVATVRREALEDAARLVIGWDLTPVGYPVGARDLDIATAIRGLKGAAEP